MDVQLYLLKSIFHPRCMVLVRIVKIRITVKVRVSVKRVRDRVRLKVSVSRVRRCMGMENSDYRVYLSVRDGN